ncbi:MAG: monovalent cation/H(+) antiporter subunit G [Xanthomonadales bacterium]|nr:monovalent cation/H(+) antiporter subunit G [Xanthomonadales bacterium]
MNWLDWLTALMVSAGGFFVFVGGVGAVRMPDLYTRMHATSLTDTLGSLLILVGLMLQSGFTLITLKIVLVAAFLLVTGPTAAYALANAAFLGGQLPEGLQDGASDDGETQP